MASLTYTLSQADLLAALQSWVATQGHVMDMVTTPVVLPGGGIVVHLNS